MILTNCNGTYYYFKAEFTLIDPVNKKASGVRFKDVAGLKEPKIEVKFVVIERKYFYFYDGKGNTILYTYQKKKNIYIS